MILGIIGGVISLLIGAVGYGAESTLGSLASSMGASGHASSMGMYSIASIALPILGLVGAGLTYKSPNAAVVMMAASAAGAILIFGLGMLSLVPAVLLGVGAALVMLDNDKASKAAK